MNTSSSNSKNVIVALLCAVSIGLMVAMYFSPIWWVSLKAPNYPEQAFPDGVRIHFHMDAIYNGCSLRESAELDVQEALNCVHEMDTINHYVGMYPSSAGGPLERSLSHFILACLFVMLIGFAIRKPGLRTGVMMLGFSLVAVWMLSTLYTEGGFTQMPEGYRHALMAEMDLDPDEVDHWSGSEAIIEYYQDTMGRFFGTQSIGKSVDVMKIALPVAAYGLIAAMFVLALLSWKIKLFYWLLILVPLALPVIFLLDYAGWLWWFGHNLNSMGAFSVKPFMPTVFGDGKVAQFSTHSYPHYGFGLMLISSILLSLAALTRRKQIRSEEIG